MSRTSRRVSLISLTTIIGLLFMFQNPHKIDAGATGAKQIFIMKLSTQPSTLRKAVNQFKNATPEQLETFFETFNYLKDDGIVMAVNKDVNKPGGYFGGPAGGDNVIEKFDSNGNLVSSFNMNTDSRATTLGAIKLAVKEAQEVGY